MGLVYKKGMGGGFMDAIRCDEPDYLIWKWHPEGTTRGNNRKENAIRWGSSLYVKESSVAVFVYSEQNNINRDYIVGPFNDILETKNLPIISRIVGLAYHGDTPFPAEVYFINLARIIQVRFAVPYFDVFDPRIPDVGVPTAVRGSISFCITDYKEFIKLHRLDNFSLEDFQVQIKNAVIRYVKSEVLNIPAYRNIPVVQIERCISEINDIVENKLRSRLFQDFGVSVSGIDIGAIELDKTSEGYKYLMTVTRDVTAESIKARTDVNIQEMYDSQRLSTLRRQNNIEEDTYARHKQTQSGNFAAYQVEAGENVGIAGAMGLGQLGSNAGVNTGGGFDPAAMVVGMNLGSTIGQNLGSTMNTMMGNISQPPPFTANSSNVPPPFPNRTYHIAVNGQTYGAYDMNAMSQMIANGQVKRDTYVWTQGLANWIKAEDIPEICQLFNLASNAAPPPPPIT